MWYSDKIDVPYNTPTTSPVRQTLELDKGTIEYIEVEVPLGHVGLTGLYITYNTIQIVPFNKVGYIYGNDRIFHIPLDYKLNVAPYELEIFAWNTDDTYPHSFSVGVMMKDKKVEEAVITLMDGI